ncbi:MAG: carboxypeptidase-like regulatory domain-containing protein [Thermoplasmata archaeon]
MPVVVPRDPPPLYSWEVLPGLYPTLPPPRRPRVRMRRMAEVALIAVAVLAVVLGGFLAALGTEAPAAGSYAVSGTVFDQTPGGGLLPAVGATVVVTDESSTKLVEQTSATGRFSFTSVPTGGVTLNITQPGYTAVSLVTFASSVYDAGTTGLSVTLTPGSTTNVTTVALSPFSDLESFLASIGSGVILLGLVAIVGGIAAVVTARSDRPAVGVVGGAAGVLAPVALYFLALGGVFPTLLTGSAVLAAVGAFAATTRTFEIYQLGPESRGS